MAGGKTVEIMGYRFTARTAPLWRRLTFDFWPYWQASTPKFVLRVTRLDSSVQRQTIKWIMRFTSIDFIEGELDVSSLQLGKPVNFEIGSGFLGFTGDTLIILPSDLASSAPALYETVYAFHITQKSWLALTLVAAFLAGVFAALGYWLLWLLN